MMTLRFVAKLKKHLANPLCQIVIFSQSLPQGKQSEAQCKGNILHFPDLREIQEPSKTKNVFV